MSIDRSKMTQTVNGAVTREAKQEDTADRGRFYWWKQRENEEQLANEIASTIRFLIQNQGMRMEQLTMATRLYGNNSNANMLGTAFTRASSAATQPMSSRISFNLCAAVIDTLTAQIAKNKVVPMFITSGGVWGMQKKAENLSKFSEGMFYEQKMPEKITYLFRDGAVWGDGFLHPYRSTSDRAMVERVLPHEIVDDLVEGLVGPLTQRHRIKVCDRGRVIQAFPKKRKEIEEAQPAAYADIGGNKTAADLITVAMSWHLRSGPSADDGLCAITLPDNGITLDQYEFTKDYFPFVQFCYSRNILGAHGQGACMRLQNIQSEINRLMILIQKSMWLGGSFKILSHVSDKVPTSHFNNETGPIIKWSGDIEPKYIAPPIIQSEIYPYVDALIDKGFRQEGVSQLQASNLKPLGVDSGAALRTVDEIADGRQLFIEQQIEDCSLEVLKQQIEIVKEIRKDKKPYTVTFGNTKFLETIDWDDIHLEEDEYWLKAFPTSELPEEPAAKYQTVQEWVQAGWITPRTARKLMRNPDIEQADNLANAAEDLICKTIEEMLYEEKWTPVRPDGEWDLVLAKQIGLEYMNYAKLHNCPENRQQRLRDFMGIVDDTMGLTTPPPMPPGPPGAAPGNVLPMPQANPQPTPVSPLIPNANGVAA